MRQTKVFSLFLCVVLLLTLLMPMGASAAGKNSIQSGSTGDPINWGQPKKVTYDPLHPFILIWSDPLSDGGLNLATQTITKKAEADLVINVYGDIGANGIVDLGNESLQAPTSRDKLNNLAASLEVKNGGVYLVVLHDGSLAKVKVDTLLPNKAYLSYVTEQAKSVTKLSPSPTSVAVKPGDTAAVKLTATYSDNTREDVTGLAQWSSDDEGVATVTGPVCAADKNDDIHRVGADDEPVLHPVRHLGKQGACSAFNRVLSGFLFNRHHYPVCILPLPGVARQEKLASEQRAYGRNAGGS
jgi:hypothetical protein